MARKQQLIHLHSAEALNYKKASDVKMALGEIAVKHATGTGDTANVNSELYILNGNTGATGDTRIVRFPSKAYVDAQISASNGDISGLQGEVDKIEAAVGLTGEGDKSAWADGMTYIKDTTTFKAAIEALDGQAKANAAAAAAAKSVVTAGDNIAVTPTPGDNGAVTYTVKAKDLVTTDTFTGFKTNIVGQTGVDGNSAAVSFTGKNYISGTTNLKAAIEELDAQAKANAEAAAAAAAAAAKHSIVKGTGNITVTSSGTGQLTYTVDGSNLATVENLTKAEGRIKTIEEFFNGAARDSGATNVIDTLKEIQDYIASDKTGAAEMTAKLGNITTVLDGYLKGTNGATGNTVIKDIIDKKADATALTAVSDSVNHIKNQAGVDGASDDVTFDDTNYLSNAHTLKAAIETLATQAKTNATEAAKHSIVKGDANITVTPSGTGQITYTLNSSKLATVENLTKAEGRIKTIEDNYVDTITITNATDRGIDVQKTGKTYTIDFDSMVIDCGEY